MGTRKCTARQLAALKRGREKLRHKRSNKTTNLSNYMKRGLSKIPTITKVGNFY